MALKSMKMDKAARDKAYAPSMVDPDAPTYPWGLCLTLDNEVLEKLGIKILPEAGETLMLAAKVKVTAAESTDTDAGKRQSVRLQITDMALEDAGEKVAASAKIYTE